MHIFYHPDHIRHDPQQLHNAENPQRDRFFSEIAQRGIIIHDALQKVEYGSINQPGDFSVDPIGEIHEYGLINLLQNAHERMTNEAGSQLALPDTFMKTAVPHKPRSIWGQLGYYAFDRTSPILEHTWEVAYWNVQVAISAAALINVRGSHVAYALCRPPGHHVGPNFYGGYGYLNNAAVAAHWLVQQGNRVAILDLDYYHGNGTQMIFYGRSDVLFCSIHADPLYEYPYYWGYADEYGEGVGKGYNFNYPMPRNTDESSYLQTLDKALDRIRLFVPDILLISLGVNIINGDPLGHFQLKTEALSPIGSAIARLALPTITIQEGGYELSTLGENVIAFFTGLLKK